MSAWTPLRSLGGNLGFLTVSRARSVGVNDVFCTRARCAEADARFLNRDTLGDVLVAVSCRARFARRFGGHQSP